MTKDEVRKAWALALAASMPDDIAELFVQMGPANLGTLVEGFTADFWPGVRLGLAQFIATYGPLDQSEEDE